MSRKYKNPPIVEAVCEFRISEDTNWDPAVPGLIYGKLQDQFPRREEQTLQEAQISVGDRLASPEVRTTQHLVLYSADGRTFVRIGPRLLGVSQLKPYTAWEEFRPAIVRAYDTLSQVTAPKGLARIGLRYINQISVPGDAIDPEPYFAFRPLLQVGLGEGIRSLMAGAVVSFAAGRDACRVQLADTTLKQPGTIDYLLDIDYYTETPSAVDSASALDWVEAAHEAALDVFEACITDRLRGILDLEG